MKQLLFIKIMNMRLYKTMNYTRELKYHIHIRFNCKLFSITIYNGKYGIAETTIFFNMMTLKKCMWFFARI